MYILKSHLLVSGEVVYVIGHAIFGADLDLSPTVTMGIVSKINRVAGIPVIIQVKYRPSPFTHYHHRGCVKNRVLVCDSNF